MPARVSFIPNGPIYTKWSSRVDSVQSFFLSFFLIESFWLNEGHKPFKSFPGGQENRNHSLIFLAQKTRSLEHQKNIQPQQDVNNGSTGCRGWNSTLEGETSLQYQVSQVGQMQSACKLFTPPDWESQSLWVSYWVTSRGSWCDLKAFHRISNLKSYSESDSESKVKS